MNLPYQTGGALVDKHPLLGCLEHCYFPVVGARPRLVGLIWGLMPLGVLAIALA